MDDRVDLSGPHDPGEDRVVGVDADVLGAFQFDGGLGGVEPDDDLDVGILLERLGDLPAPEGAEAGDEDPARPLPVGAGHPNQTDRRRRSMS